VKNPLKTRQLNTEIAIIGGGISGITASLAAAENGKQVTIVCKGFVGRSGNTLVSGAAISAVLPTDENVPNSFGDSLKKHCEDTLASGLGINDEVLVRALSQEAGLGILKLEEWGVTFCKTDGDYVRGHPPGHGKPRSISADYAGLPYQTRGLSLTLPLAKRAKEKGVRFQENTIVVDILKDSKGEACGLLAIDKVNQELLVIVSKAVVIAAGGLGHIYKITNNTRDITGDSYAMALRAGATLRDMEFIQFYPSRMVQPIKIPVPNSLFNEGACLRNVEGELFMGRYDERGDMATRDVMARAIFQEGLSARGVQGGVYIDLKQVPANLWDGKFSIFAGMLSNSGVDPRRDYLIISPCTHHCMGGIIINEWCETEIGGLLATGEAAGGVHGANRLPGNALAEAVVFGIRAGKRAVLTAKERKTGNPELFRSLPGVGSNDRKRVDIIREKVKEVMWSSCSLIRKRDSLEYTLNVLECLRAEFASIKEVGSITELCSYVELDNIILTATTVAKSAILREESRGAHYREDIPASKNEWRGNTIIHQTVTDVECFVEFRKPGSIME